MRILNNESAGFKKKGMKFERKLSTKTNKPNFTFFYTFHKIHNFFTIHHKLSHTNKVIFRN